MYPNISDTEVKRFVQMVQINSINAIIQYLLWRMQLNQQIVCDS